MATLGRSRSPLCYNLSAGYDYDTVTPRQAEPACLEGESSNNVISKVKTCSERWHNLNLRQAGTARLDGAVKCSQIGGVDG